MGGALRRTIYAVVLGFFFGAFLLLALRGFIEVKRNVEFLARLADSGECGKLGWKTYYIAVNRVPAAVLPLIVVIQRPAARAGKRFVATATALGFLAPLVGIVVGGMGIHSLAYGAVAYLVARRIAGQPLWLSAAYVYAATSFTADFYEWPIMFFDNKVFIFLNRTWFYTVFLLYMTVWHRMRPTKTGATLLAVAAAYPVAHILVMNRLVLGPVPWEVQTISTALARILWALAFYNTKMEPRAPHRWLLV